MPRNREFSQQTPRFGGSPPNGKPSYGEFTFVFGLHSKCKIAIHDKLNGTLRFCILGDKPALLKGLEVVEFWASLR